MPRSATKHYESHNWYYRISLAVKYMYTKIRQTGLCLLFGIACFVIPTPAPADIAALSEGQGYLLIRVQTNPRERVRQFFMADIDSETVVAMRIDDFLDVGSSAWMAVVPAPKGRYYLSVYEPFYDKGTPIGRNLNQIHRRFAPDSADETFEIEAGVINYVGDWKMRLIASTCAKV